jgi:hypothetical protein
MSHVPCGGSNFPGLPDFPRSRGSLAFGALRLRFSLADLNLANHAFRFQPHEID